MSLFAFLYRSVEICLSRKDLVASTPSFRAVLSFASSVPRCHYVMREKRYFHYSQTSLFPPDGHGFWAKKKTRCAPLPTAVNVIHWEGPRPSKPDTALSRNLVFSPIMGGCLMSTWTWSCPHGVFRLQTGCTGHDPDTTRPVGKTPLFDHAVNACSIILYNLVVCLL